MTETRKKALVVYESLFGNTRKVAEAIGAGLEPFYEVQVLEVSHANPSVGDASLVVAGGPIHAFGMTRPGTRADAEKQAKEKGWKFEGSGVGLREWLQQLEFSTAHVDAAAFDTGVKLGWFVVGSAAKGEAAALKDKGFNLVAKPEHFLVKGSDGPLLAGEVERATAWARSVAANAH
ncbi:MAG: flavodoxin [Archangiaceae bacterium]|nr:flavodoxin [Archangiaceae bacterium]